MSIEIKPETERLVQEEITKGHFHSVDEIIIEGVQARRQKQPAKPTGASDRLGNHPKPANDNASVRDIPTGGYAPSA